MVSGDDQFPTLVISVPFASRSVIVICLSASFHSNVPVSLNAPPPSICPSVRTSSTLEEPRREKVTVPLRGPDVTGLSRPVYVKVQAPAKYSTPCCCRGWGGPPRRPPRRGPGGCW